MALPQQLMQPYNPAQAYNPYQKQKQGWGQWLKEAAVGKAPGLQQVPTATPNQASAREYATQFGLNALQNPTEGFEPIGNYARQQFNQQTLPDMLERLTSLGGHGQASLSSPAIQSQLASGGSQLDQFLAMLMAQYGQQQQQTGLQALDFGDRSQFQYQQTPGSSGILGGLWNAGSELAPILAQAGLMYATNGLTGAPALADLFKQFSQKRQAANATRKYVMNARDLYLNQ